MKREPKKPFDMAILKFQNEQQVISATEKLRYIKLKSGQSLRFLPFD
jgi:hypothetical protein